MVASEQNIALMRMLVSQGLTWSCICCPNFEFYSVKDNYNNDDNNNNNYNNNNTIIIIIIIIIMTTMTIIMIKRRFIT